MQMLNNKERKLLELQITQTRHPKSVVDGCKDGRGKDRVDPLLDLLRLKRRRKQTNPGYPEGETQYHRLANIPHTHTRTHFVN